MLEGPTAPPRRRRAGVGSNPRPLAQKFTTSEAVKIVSSESSSVVTVCPVGANVASRSTSTSEGRLSYRATAGSPSAPGSCDVHRGPSSSCRRGNRRSRRGFSSTTRSLPWVGPGEPVPVEPGEPGTEEVVVGLGVRDDIVLLEGHAIVRLELDVGLVDPAFPRRRTPCSGPRSRQKVLWSQPAPANQNQSSERS